MFDIQSHIFTHKKNWEYGNSSRYFDHPDINRAQYLW